MVFALAPWAIQLIVGVALSVAGTLGQAAFSGQQRREQRGLTGTFESGGKVPQSILVGTIGIPGKLEYRNTYGDSGGTPNAYLVDLISLGDVNISGFTDFYVNTQDVTKSATGHTSLGYPVAEYLIGTSDHLWWEFFDGSQTAANSFLTSKFGSDPDRPWLSDMIGRGVPYVTLTARIQETLWTGWPSYIVECQGIPLYDVRLDTTAGGSGAHRWDTPATHAFTDNSLAIVYTLLRGVLYGGEHLWGGQGTAYQFPYAEWEAALDACDVDIDLDGGGTEKQFRAGREIFVSERPADVVEELLTGANARIAVVAGRYYPLVGVPGAAAGTFTDADAIVTDGTTLDVFPNIDGIVNGATATYLEPEQAWQPKETAPHYRSDLEAEDDDRRQLAGLSLDTTFSGTQAQRVLKAVVEESRRFKRHVITLPPGYGQYRVLETLAWTSTANSYSSKLFLITSKTELPNGNVILGLQEIDAADYDWDETVDEQPIEFAPLTPIRPAAQDTDGFDAAAYTYVDALANNRRPGVMASWDGGLDDIRAIRVQVRLDGETEVIFDGEFSYDITEATPEKPIPHPFLPAEDYEVRGLYLPYDGSGRETEWSAWIAVTTPDVGFGLADMGGSVSDQIAWIIDSIRARGYDLSQLAQQVLDQGSIAGETFKQLRTQLEVVRGLDSALYQNLITVAVAEVDGDLVALAARTELLEATVDDPATGVAATATAVDLLQTTVTSHDGSITANASAITALDVHVDDISAGGFAGFQVGADPGGGEARYDLRLYAETADAYYAGGISLRINKTTGAVTLDIDADETNVTGRFDADTILQDGTLITDLIEDEAVSAIEIASPAGDQFVTGSGAPEVVLMTLSITPNSGAVMIQAMMLLQGTDTGGNTNGDILIYRDSTLLKQWEDVYIYAAPAQPGPFIFIDSTPGTSSVTYEVRGIAPYGAGNGFTASDRNIMLTNLKK